MQDQASPIILFVLIVVILIPALLGGCATPSDFRMSDGISQSDGASMAKIIGSIK